MTLGRPLPENFSVEGFFDDLHIERGGNAAARGVPIVRIPDKRGVAVAQDHVMDLEVFRLRQSAIFLAVSIEKKIPAGLAPFGEPNLVQIISVFGKREIACKDEIRQAVENRKGF